jgi:hypothetical protein
MALVVPPILFLGFFFAYIYYSNFKKVESSSRSQSSVYKTGSTEIAIKSNSHLQFTMTEIPNAMTDLPAKRNSSLIPTSGTFTTSNDKPITTITNTKDTVSTSLIQLKTTHMNEKMTSSSSSLNSNATTIYHTPNLTATERLMIQDKTELKSTITKSSQIIKSGVSTATAPPSNTNTQSTTWIGI